MRTLLVALLVFGSLPLIVIKPHVGVLVWSWIGYMNPHRLTWGFTYDFPLAMVVGVATIVAWLFSREPKSLPWHPLVLLLAIFAAWVSLTTLFAAYPDHAQAKWDRTIKVLLFNGFVTLGLITTRRRLDALIWVIVLSLGLFALKGAAFTLLTGGNYRLFGPPASFIADNAGLGLALLMVIPLVRYLQLTAARRWVRLGLLCSIPCFLVAILATYSRGAVVGLGVTLIALALKSRHRMRLALIAGIALAGAVQFMPEHWHARVDSIASYDKDASAQGRLQSWRYGLEVARDSPVMGGGFEIFRGNKVATSAGLPQRAQHLFRDTGRARLRRVGDLSRPRDRNLHDRRVDRTPGPRASGPGLGSRSRGDGPGQHCRVRGRGAVPQSRNVRPLLPPHRHRRHRVLARTTAAGCRGAGGFGRTLTGPRATF